MIKRNAIARLRLIILCAVPILLPACRLFVTQPPLWIMYVSADVNMNLCKMRPDGSGWRQLTANSGSNYNYSWSPDGSRIAFLSNRDGIDNIFVMNADGSCQYNLTHSSGPDSYPSRSPDGNRFVYDTMRGIRREVCVINADGSGFRQLTSDPAYDSITARWSPDGTRIAFERNFDIWVMNTDGSGEVSLTNDGASPADIIPAWSPDGSRVAFMSDRTSGNEIWTVNANDRTLHQVSNVGGGAQYPVWSPDGQKISFSVGNSQAYVFFADRTGVSALATPLPANTFNLEWTDDGGLIVYSLSGDIYIQAADGSGTPIQLTSGANYDTAPKFIR